MLVLLRSYAQSPGCFAYGIGNELGRPARDGGLLDDNGTLTGVLSHNASDSLKGGHISSATGTDTTVLGRGVDSNQDNVGLADALGHVGREEQVALALGN